VFRRTADPYDLFYDWKDYAAEVERLAVIVAERVAGARTLLDVACGTGRHLELLRSRFVVEGVDLDAGLLAVARERLGPDVPLHRGDMRRFDLGREFDVVTCLFSSIGYARTLAGLRRAARAMARHVRRGGLLIIEPWFTPTQFDPQVMGRAILVERPDLRAVRMNASRIVEGRSVMDFRYLVSRPGGIRHIREIHDMGLFTDDQYRGALEAAGLAVEHDLEGLTGRGLWLGTRRE